MDNDDTPRPLRQQPDDAVTPGSGQARPKLVIDFVGGAVGYRLRQGGGLGHALARAAGFKRGNIPTVVDATAGLGRDAFLLATLGAQVTLFERSPQVHALLEEALARARAARPELAAIVQRMTLIKGDARDLLPHFRADVVLVDPMHPLRRSTALVKQEMRLLRELAGTDPDAARLTQAALCHARKRVVLKWPRHADALPGLPKPSHQILSSTVRYDVFMMPSSDTERSFVANVLS
jgi:16S rRNA (guanine1516-N2)-methyltransferase